MRGNNVSIKTPEFKRKPEKKSKLDCETGQNPRGAKFLPPTHPPEVPLWALKSKTMN